MNKHVAVKCTYNNGGEGDLVGFYGTCSEEIIKNNVRSHIWCSQPECLCRQYFESGLLDKRPIDPCLESTLFKEWWFGAGAFHTGKKSGQPIKARLKEGGVCLLTTRFPGDKEEDRKIIGLYRIGSVTDFDNEETRFFADDRNKIRLPIDEAKQLYFWEYYSINSDKPRWGTGLLRYLNDGQVKKILIDLKQTVQSYQHKEIITNLLDTFDSSLTVQENYFSNIW